MKISALVILLFLILGCDQPKKETENQKELYWATQFADGLMHRSDSLIYYLRDKPKYEYDYAFLASAIDKLGDVDQKYSKYTKDYIEYFVQPDGKINGHKLSNYNIDRIRPGLNMLELYKRTGEEKYKIAIETLVGHMENQPRTNSKGYPVLENTCGACGLGGNPYREADYKYYISEKKVDNDQKGVAPVKLAAIELNK